MHLPSYTHCDSGVNALSPFNFPPSPWPTPPTRRPGHLILRRRTLGVLHKLLLELWPVILHSALSCKPASVSPNDESGVSLYTNAAHFPLAPRIWPHALDIANIPLLRHLVFSLASRETSVGRTICCLFVQRYRERLEWIIVGVRGGITGRWLGVWKTNCIMKEAF